VRIESYLFYVDHNIAIHFWILLGVVARVCERHDFWVRKADMRLWFLVSGFRGMITTVFATQIVGDG
jgi:hypothetical protein